MDSYVTAEPAPGRHKRRNWTTVLVHRNGRVPLTTIASRAVELPQRFATRVASALDRDARECGLPIRYELVRS